MLEPAVVVNRGRAARSCDREQSVIMNREVVAVVNWKSCPVQDSSAVLHLSQMLAKHGSHKSTGSREDPRLHKK